MDGRVPAAPRMQLEQPMLELRRFRELVLGVVGAEGSQGHRPLPSTGHSSGLSPVCSVCLAAYGKRATGSQSAPSRIYGTTPLISNAVKFDSFHIGLNIL